MSQQPISIPKAPVLDPAEDFYRLRREGIGFIEQMASQLWTDYNTHDPGITTLEALCYAITDLAYRTRWDIKDILAPETASPAPLQPYPHQAFFTARDILTVNPVTPDDFRRLLIDLEKVRNAWVVCKACACEPSYYAWCDGDQLRLSYRKDDPGAKQVFPLGLYDALLELEAAPGLGDLNDRKIEHKTGVHDGKVTHPVTLELRFPGIALTRPEQWKLFLADDAVAKLELTRFGATKDYDLFGDAALDEDGRNAYLRKHWRGVFYASLTIAKPSKQKIIFENAALRVFGSNGAKTAMTAQQLKAWLEDKAAGGFIQRYRLKAKATDEAIASAKKALRSHRNLDEDYCTVKVAGVEEVAVCADVEVRPDADIEWVQANIWFRIEQYFNAPVPLHTLKELLDADEAVEVIFNGPELDSGFIKAEDLEAAMLKTWLRTSDIVNLLMDIDGVVTVNQLQFTKYDAEGNAVAGAADPAWVDEKPVFDPARKSASWLLRISAQHQPRLYLNLSRFLFYKNGLPFSPRMDEAADTLTQLRGESERPKNPDACKDLPVPAGTFRNPEDYYPVQYSFPLVYGVGPHGLPSNASALRQAQARQMKAYLMVFEQILGNALAQLAHTGDLFSLDPSISRTYFVRAFGEKDIVGFNDISNGLTEDAVKAITETPPEFLERRNRFLDHLLARFGEQFGEYALLLSRNTASKQEARARLIDDKLSFLSAYRGISHDRAKALDYAKPWPYSDNGTTGLNEPGIKQRIGLLLGCPDLEFSWTVAAKSGKFRFDFELRDRNGKVWLKGRLARANDSKAEARHALLGRMNQPENYQILPDGTGYRLRLKGEKGKALGEFPDPFDSTADAALALDELVAWSAHERLIVVEHLLLRPKFPGDALYPACSEGGCKLCGDEDPYSFRLTFVMPGWTTRYAENLDMRRFAERTIQQETPSHLLAKICWVGNDGLVANPCAQIIGDLAEAILESGAAASEAAACACAKDIYAAFGAVFEDWHEEKAPDAIPPGALEALFADKQKIKDELADAACVAILDACWDGIRPMLVEHFWEAAVRGLQFDRFEDAWGRWLDANSKIDWTEERLQARVEAILRDKSAPGQDEDEAICECAVSLLSQYGKAFFLWMEENLKQGTPWDFSTFSASLGACAQLALPPDTVAAVKEMLDERYKDYAEVSYRLWIVVNRLAALRSVYPGATLHDCDDGSDENPVRLDSTALGNYKLRTPDT